MIPPDISGEKAMTGSPTKSGLKGPRYPPLLCALMIIIVSVAFTGCTSQAGTSPAAASQERSAVVSIGDIIRNPSTYNGTQVLIRGKIITECGSGCWFIVDDGTGTLYVDLAPNNFVIPQISGTTVVVHGSVAVKNGDSTLVATKVVTDLRTYP
jgi:uncharacterized protein YdeI (BOF family)